MPTRETEHVEVWKFLVTLCNSCWRRLGGWQPSTFSQEISFRTAGNFILFFSIYSSYNYHKAHKYNPSSCSPLINHVCSEYLGPEHLSSIMVLPSTDFTFIQVACIISNGSSLEMSGYPEMEMDATLMLLSGCRQSFSRRQWWKY